CGVLGGPRLCVWAAELIAGASRRCLCFFFFTDPATTEFSTLSLHDALPIWMFRPIPFGVDVDRNDAAVAEMIHDHGEVQRAAARSEEHTSELQSRGHLVCRLLLEKKNG